MLIDYNFQAIKPRDDDNRPINIRVNYINLLDYWDDVTDTPAKVRRDLQEETISRIATGGARSSRTRSLMSVCASDWPRS